MDQKKEQESDWGLDSDFAVEPDLFPPGAWSAFLFIQDKGWQEALQNELESQGFYLRISADAKEARQKLRLNAYDLVLIQESSQSASLLQEIGYWPGSVRREVNVILLGESGPSFDPALAFRSGVNTYIALQDREQALNLLQQSQDNFQHFLRPWELARERVGANT